MAYSISGILGVDLDAESSTQLYPLGTVVCGTASTSDLLSAEYMYVRADEAITQYQFVKIDDDYECAPLTTTISGAEPTHVGCAQIAFTANYYGWVAISGTFTGLISASCAADVKLKTSATAGYIDDAGGDFVNNVKLNTTITAAAASTCYAVARMTTNTTASDAAA